MEWILVLYVICQIIYSITFILELYFITRPVNSVDVKAIDKLSEEGYPLIVQFYPVLREQEKTMRTTLQSFAKIDYPNDRYRIIAIPNSNDKSTIESLKCLQNEFSFLEILEVPPTTDPSWQLVWDAWDANEKVYWWHIGDRAKNRDLPPKKTRQLIYALYRIAKEYEGKEDFLLVYQDADSCIPSDHFLAGAIGSKQYDVVQATNIAANFNDSWAASCHAFDHMVWDGLKYPHLTANGKHPYWTLGKAAFFRGSDLIALGSFHPWISIEDPEVGIRFWMNGKKMGIIEKPIIEEVPITTWEGFMQRRRWICGFFQTLSEPLTRLGMTPIQKFLTWMNFLPNLYLWINVFGLPTGIWALWMMYHDKDIFPLWVVIISACNIVAWCCLMVYLYYNTWKRTALVRDKLWPRIWFLLRMNPLMAMVWWTIWFIPIVMGFKLYMGEGGLVWNRTEKLDANAPLFRSQSGKWFKK